MTNAYLVVTDLHCDTEKSNRINYFGEILSAIESIIRIGNDYRQKGYSVKLIFLGDVFDAGMSNPSDAMQLMEVFYFLCSSFDGVWSVVGNHEISYAKNNPFWFLVSQLGDEGLLGLKRFIQPRGLNSRIVVPDMIEDGDTVLYFNHYSTVPKVPDHGKVRIGLFHQNVGSNAICKMWGTFDNVEEASYVQAYNYAFFGHMHLAKGAYWLNEAHTCRGEWLGTIGRTKVDEVLDDSLDVNIPVIIVKDGKFQKIEDNPIHLWSRQESIDFPKLEASQKSKELVMERNQVATNNYHGETLFETLEGAFAGTPLAFLFSFLDHPWDDVYREYTETLSNPLASESKTEEDDLDGTDSFPNECTPE